MGLHIGHHELLEGASELWLDRSISIDGLSRVSASPLDRQLLYGCILYLFHSILVGAFTVVCKSIVFFERSSQVAVL